MRRRRPTLTALVALCSLLFVVAGCSDDGGSSDDDGSTTTEAAAEESTTTAPEAEDAEVDCAAYLTVTDLVGSREEIATGSADAQVAADGSLATALATLAPAGEGDEFITEALATLGDVSFQVSDEATGPSADEIDSALVTIEDAWSSQCPAPAEGEAGDPGAAPETTTPECPAPEVLEAEGFSCDETGQLTPLDEETEGECPAPEVLEAEGYTCDETGQLTPTEDADPAEDPPAGDEPVECPAPEVLEAQGLSCDSEGNLTPVE